MLEPQHLNHPNLIYNQRTGTQSMDGTIGTNICICTYKVSYDIEFFVVTSNKNGDEGDHHSKLLEDMLTTNNYH